MSRMIIGWLRSQFQKPQEITCYQHEDQIILTINKEIYYEGPLSIAPADVKEKLRIFHSYHDTL